jgi:hypothetical protein
MEIKNNDLFNSAGLKLAFVHDNKIYIVSRYFTKGRKMYINYYGIEKLLFIILDSIEDLAIKEDELKNNGSFKNHYNNVKFAALTAFNLGISKKHIISKFLNKNLQSKYLKAINEAEEIYNEGGKK